MTVYGPTVPLALPPSTAFLARRALILAAVLFCMAALMLAMRAAALATVQWAEAERRLLAAERELEAAWRAVEAGQGRGAREADTVAVVAKEAPPAHDAGGAVGGQE